MKKPKIKQYIGISRDHSGSMQSIVDAAQADYNATIASIKEEAKVNDIDTIVSVIKCGVGFRGLNEFEVTNSNVDQLRPICGYKADGYHTPLFDSIADLIDLLLKVPDAKKPNVSFLIMVVTDGENNYGRQTGKTIGARIRELQATDRWTFSFRVPYGYKRNLVSLGIPDGNILEWEHTIKGMEHATVSTRSAVKTYFHAAASGSTHSTRFYADLSSVKPIDVRSELKNITKDVTFWPVKTTASIREFVEKKLRGSMTIGCAFYELTKAEKAVQDYKIICIRNKNSKAVYGGDAARDLLGIPKAGDIKLSPGNTGEFDVFIQSTSTNRKLMPNTEVLYWANAIK